MDYATWTLGFFAAFAIVGRPGYDVDESERFFCFDVGYDPEQAAGVCARNDPAAFR